MTDRRFSPPTQSGTVSVSTLIPAETGCRRFGVETAVQAIGGRGDPAHLTRSPDGAGMVTVSDSMLAILPKASRRRLRAEMSKGRYGGDVGRRRSRPASVAVVRWAGDARRDHGRCSRRGRGCAVAGGGDRAVRRRLRNPDGGNRDATSGKVGDVVVVREADRHIHRNGGEITAKGRDGPRETVEVVPPESDRRTRSGRAAGTLTDSSMPVQRSKGSGQSQRSAVRRLSRRGSIR